MSGRSRASSAASHRLLCRRGAGVVALAGAASFFLTALSCSPSRTEDVVHVAGRDHRVSLDLGSGPLDDLVIVRDTAGHFVVSGLCFFPDGTRLTVALYDSSGTPLARTQPTVEDALFRSLPLGPDQGTALVPGRYALEISAEFAPGAQPPRVVRALGSGREFSGPGMTKSRQGHPAYSRRFQFRM
jgi:hypothetical protein